MQCAPILKAAEAITGGPDGFDGLRTYFATADVEGADLLEGTPVTFDERPTRANLVAQLDDVLFAKMQATDKVVHVDRESQEGIFSTGFFNLRARCGLLDPRYLFWFLRSRQFRHEKDRRCTGATQKALTLSGLREISIPLLHGPREQKRVARILDNADVIRRKRGQAVTMADRLVRSWFLEMFGTPLRNPRCLPTAPIRGFGRVVTGNTPPRREPENYGDDIEWIKSDNINTRSYFLTRAEEHLSSAGRRLGRTAPAGSTLVTCIAGSPSVIGNAALADREVAFNQQINAVIPNDQTDPYFLYCQFLVAKDLVQASSTNSMKGMVSKGRFQEIRFLRPDREEQIEFGRVFRRVAGMTRRLEDGLSESEEMFESLSQRAFCGEL